MIFLLFILLTNFHYVNGANILFLNGARIGQSHLFYMGKLADILAQNGHNVTYYQQETYPSVNKPGVKIAKYHVRPAIGFNATDFTQDLLWGQRPRWEMFAMWKEFGDNIFAACKCKTTLHLNITQQQNSTKK